MKLQTIGIALTVINLVILTILISQLNVAKAQQGSAVAPVVRAHALEIVDTRGKVRASITIEKPVTVDGKLYPETVLLRLTDNTGSPNVKISTAVDGSAMGLSDNANGGLLIRARNTGTILKLTHKSQEKVIQP